MEGDRRRVVEGGEGGSHGCKDIMNLSVLDWKGKECEMC